MILLTNFFAPSLINKFNQQQLIYGRFYALFFTFLLNNSLFLFLKTILSLKNADIFYKHKVLNLQTCKEMFKTIFFRTKMSRSLAQKHQLMKQVKRKRHEKNTRK